jgi:hypothetical protein
VVSAVVIIGSRRCGRRDRLCHFKALIVSSDDTIKGHSSVD